LAESPVESVAVRSDGMPWTASVAADPHAKWTLTYLGPDVPVLTGATHAQSSPTPVVEVQASSAALATGPDPDDVEVALAEADAMIALAEAEEVIAEATSDSDHFYGAWSGGSAKSGGGPSGTPAKAARGKYMSKDREAETTARAGAYRREHGLPATSGPEQRAQHGARAAFDREAKAMSDAELETAYDKAVRAQKSAQSRAMNKAGTDPFARAKALDTHHSLLSTQGSEMRLEALRAERTARANTPGHVSPLSSRIGAT